MPSTGKHHKRRGSPCGNGFHSWHPFPLLPSVALLVVLPIYRFSRRLFHGVREFPDYAGPFTGDCRGCCIAFLHSVENHHNYIWIAVLAVTGPTGVIATL